MMKQNTLGPPTPFSPGNYHGPTYRASTRKPKFPFLTNFGIVEFLPSQQTEPIRNK